MSPNRPNKNMLGTNYGYAREIRPKQIMIDQSLNTPPMKKIKTEPTMANGQNGMNFFGFIFHVGWVKIS